MKEIKAGGRVILTEAIPESVLYPWLKPGVEGVVKHVRAEDYSILFEGEYVVTCPKSHPVSVTDPVLIFLPEEIELKEDG